MPLRTKQVSNDLRPWKPTPEHVVRKGCHKKEAEHGDRERHRIEAAELNATPSEQEDEGRDEKRNGK